MISRRFTHRDPVAVLRRLLGDRWANRRRITALWPNPVDDWDAIHQANRDGYEIGIALGSEGPDHDERVRAARRHLTTAVRHAIAALQDVQAWHGTTDDAERRVREVAAHHQLTDAMHALGKSRAALPSPPRDPGGPS